MTPWLLPFLFIIVIASIGTLTFLVRKRGSGQFLSMFDRDHIDARVHRVGDADIAEPILPEATGLLFWRRGRPMNLRKLLPSGREKRHAPEPSGENNKKRAENRNGLLVAAVSFIILGTILTQVPTITRWFQNTFATHYAEDPFVVLVASFHDGGDGQMGARVANQLAGKLEQQGEGQFVVERLDIAPTSAGEAEQLATQRGADVLLWGSVQNGELPDSPSFQPRLVYIPTGAYVPNAWDGYAGRFCLPHSYAVASTPINGNAVLPRLVMVLADYSIGDADVADDDLQRLITDYPALQAVPLPYMLHGNVLWARGNNNQAIAAYQQALDLLPPEQAQERAMLSNNLGAILFDSGYLDVAHSSIVAADQVLTASSPERGAVSFNIGLLLLRQGLATQAATRFEQAASMLPDSVPHVPVLLAQVDALIQAGQRDKAASVLTLAEKAEGSDGDSVPAELQPLWAGALQSALYERQGLLSLAQNVQARGPLTWELEVAPPYPDRPMQEASDKLRTAIESSRSLAVEWHRRTTAQQASFHFTRNQPVDAIELVSSGQSRRTDATLRRQQYELALALIEEARANLSRPPGTLTSLRTLLFENSNAMGEAQTILESLVDPSCSDAVPYTLDDEPMLNAYARLLRLQGVNDQAERCYDRIIALAPTYPEGYYGKARVALTRGDRGLAYQYMALALQHNDQFYPARFGMAALDDLDGRYAEAEAILTPLVDAGNVEARIQRGRIRRSAGNIEGAIQDFEQAVRDTSSKAGTAYELGLTLQAKGDMQGAEKQFLAAIQAEPNDTRARLELADLSLNALNKPGQAIAQYEAVLNAHIQNTDRLLQMGDTFFQYGKFDLAHEAYIQAKAMQPDNPQVLARLAKTYLQHGSTAAAIEEGQRVLALSDDPALREQTVAVLGEAELQRGGVDQAIAYYNQVLDTYPVQANIGLGRAVAAQGNWGAAQGYFQNAVNLTGQSNPVALFWLAEAVLRQGNATEAARLYEQATTMTGCPSEAWVGLAQAQYALDDSKDTPALATLNKAVQAKPDYAEAYLVRCRILREQGRIDDALDDCTSAINASPRIAEAYAIRGTLRIQTLDYAGAVSDLRRAANLQPDPETYYWLGRAYFDLNNMYDAVAAFKQAVALRGGNYPDALFYQGQAEARLGQHDSALASLQRVIQSTTDSELVRRASDEVQRIVDLDMNAGQPERLINIRATP